MKTGYLRSYLELHFIIFIWGFTAILGKLISLDATYLVCYRMLFTVIFLGLFMFISKQSFRLHLYKLGQYLVFGLIISLHWILFFYTIKISNVSIAVSCLATGAFFTALLEPFFGKKKWNYRELLIGFIAFLGIYFIVKANFNHLLGIFIGLLSSLFSALFSIINGKMMKRPHTNAIQMAFYEMLGGFLGLSIFTGIIFIKTGIFPNLLWLDLLWLIILSLVCTAYAFVASLKVMKHIDAYTLMLTNNLEPIYGILLALLIFGKKECMDFLFYLGLGIIIFAVLLNTYYKLQKK